RAPRPRPRRLGAQAGRGAGGEARRRPAAGAERVPPLQGKSLRLAGAGAVSPERWVRRRFRLSDDRVDAFAAELWTSDPLGVEIQEDCVVAYWREGESPPWT